MTPKKIALLGSTGSIGTQTLDVVRDHPECFKVVALSGFRNHALLMDQAAEFCPEMVWLPPEQPQGELPSNCRWAAPGMDGLLEITSLDSVDLVVVATVGSAGLLPTFNALQKNKEVALANKEVLVMGGDLLMQEAQRLGKRIIPIDSEHSAILQCLQGEEYNQIRKLVVTASGGPFREWNASEIDLAQPEDALCHPTWSMGQKITIDSATLMNKGLEVIEAHHLFQVPIDMIEVLIHPQSIIHSMVEFEDGAVMAQMGLPDMKIPIQFALTFPARIPRQDPSLNLAELGQLTFHAPEVEKFPCLQMAYEACRKGGGYPTVLSVANEEAVYAFLDHRIRLGGIHQLIERELSRFDDRYPLTIENIQLIEQDVRRSVKESVRQMSL